VYKPFRKVKRAENCFIADRDPSKWSARQLLWTMKWSWVPDQENQRLRK
jgi:hypothetical protein